jgi:phosphoglycolate phosphatase-like HAD superfamily hydrolase
MGPAYVLSEGLGIPPHSERGRAIAARREAIFREHYLPRIPAALGAGRLLAMCRGRGLRMAAVTPGDRAEAILLLRRVGLGRHLPRVFGGVGAPEPKADGLAEAVRSFGLAGDGIALVGDSPFAVALAARHGIAAIGLLSGGWSRESLEGAARIYHDTAELLACFAFSPFALPPLREASSN